MRRGRVTVVGTRLLRSLVQHAWPEEPGKQRRAPVLMPRCNVTPTRKVTRKAVTLTRKQRCCLFINIRSAGGSGRGRRIADGRERYLGTVCGPFQRLLAFSGRNIVGNDRGHHVTKERADSPTHRLPREYRPCVSPESPTPCVLRAQGENARSSAGWSTSSAHAGA